MSTVTKNYTCDILELPDYLSQQAKQGLMIKKNHPLQAVFHPRRPCGA